MFIVNDGVGFDTYKLVYSSHYGTYQYDGTISVDGLVVKALSNKHLFMMDMVEQSVVVYEMSDGGGWAELQEIADSNKFTTLSNKTMFGNWIKVSPSGNGAVITSYDSDFSSDFYYSENAQDGLGYNAFYSFDEVDKTWSKQGTTTTLFYDTFVTEFGYKGGWVSADILFLHRYENVTQERVIFYNSTSWDFTGSSLLYGVYNDLCGVSGGAHYSIIGLLSSGAIEILDVDTTTYVVTSRQNITDPGTSGGSSFGSNIACMSKGFVTGNYRYVVDDSNGMFSVAEVLTPDPGSDLVVGFGSNTHAYGFVNNVTRSVNIFQNTPKPTMSPTGSPTKSPTTRSPTLSPITPVASTPVPTGSPTSLGNSPGETTGTPTVAPEPSVFEEPLMVASLGILGMLVLSLITLFFLRDTAVAPASYFSLA